MKHTILFSLLVHEEPDVIVETVLNLLKYNPNSGVVLHINPKFNQGKSGLTLEEALEKLTNFSSAVYVNPERLPVGFANLIQAHVSNYRFTENIDYGAFYFVSSNEVFLRQGAESIVGEYDCGYEKKSPRKWHYFADAQKDEDLRGIIAELGGEEIIYSQIEGSFYRKDIAGKVFEVIAKHFDWHSQTIIYPREEVYFSTIATLLFPEARRFDGCLCKIRWQGKVLFTPLKTADAVKLGKLPQFYSVKRVDRVLDDYLRCYIRHYLLQDDEFIAPFLNQPLPIVPLRTIKQKDRRYRFVYFWRDKAAKLYRFITRKQ